MKLQQMKSGQYTLTLPKQLILAMEWNKQDVIEVKVIGSNELKLSKKK